MRTAVVDLSQTQAERAARLFRDGVSFICHDHELLPAGLDALRRSGVTAKQLHISCDGQIYADQRTFWSSATRDQLIRERTRVGASIDDLPPPADTAATGVYLRSAVIAIEYVREQIDASEGGLVLALEPQDIREAKRRGAAALMLGSEGSRFIQDSVEVLRALQRLGLRHLQLSWAWETSVGTPQSDTSGRGLTDFGRELVHELNDLGVMIDVAHLSYASIAEVVEISRVPVLCSHTGALALNPEQSVMLPDHLLRNIADAGGVVAVHFMSQIVKPGRHKATFAELMAQFRYLIDLIGPRHVAYGPDFAYLDPRMWENAGIAVPFSYAEGVDDITQMENVTRGLVSLGLSDADVLAIQGENLMGLFEDVRSAATRTHGRPIPPGAIGARTGGTTPL
jgi:membrane dipeptidase